MSSPGPSLCLCLCLCLCLRSCFSLLPASPLYLCTSPPDLSQYAVQFIEILEEATLPTKPDEVIAIVVGETIAGFTGGFASRLVGNAIGDLSLRKDRSFMQSTTTGTYFGIRSAMASATALLGIPAPIARAIATVTASIASEIMKIEGRKTEMESSKQNQSEIKWLEEQFEKEWNEIMGRSQMSDDKKPLVSGPEVMQDVVKWIAYDLLLPTQVQAHTPAATAAAYGAVSGLIAFAVFEIFSRRSLIFLQDRESPLKFGQAALESATLFACYESCISVLETTTPPELKKLLLQDFSQYFPF
jgi:hypothetical protein